VTWLLRLLGGGLPDQLRRAYEAKLNAANDSDRIAAEVEIARLTNRLARSDNRALQWAIALIAFAMGGHLAAVAFVSAFPFWGWTVHALPAPMNEWQAQIILGLFGLSMVARLR
jgi:hypothetical protein